MKKLLLIYMLLFNVVLANEYFYIQDNKKINLIKIDEISDTISKIDYYKTDNDIVLGVKNQLFVKFKTLNNLNKYKKEFDLIVLNIYGKDLYLFQTKDKSLTLKIGNDLSLKNDVLYSQANFIKNTISR